MKRLNKIVTLTAIFFIFVSAPLLRSFSFSGFGGFSEPTTTTTGTASTTAGSGTQKVVTGPAIPTEESCQRENFKEHINLSNMQMMMGGTQDPFKIQLIPSDRPTSVKIEMRPFLRGCINFEDENSFEHLYDPATNNLAVSFKSKITLPDDDSNSTNSNKFFEQDCSGGANKQMKYLCAIRNKKTGQISQDEYETKLTQKEKIDLCLLGLLDKNDRPVTKVEGGEVVPEITDDAKAYFSDRENYNFPPVFELSLIDSQSNAGVEIYDANRPIKIVHGSYMGGNNYFGQTANNDISLRKNCLRYEEVGRVGNSEGRSGFYIMTPEQAAISGVENICNSGGSEQIEQAVTDLSRRVGNYSNLNDDLINQLTAMLKAAKGTVATGERVERIAELYQDLIGLGEDCGETGLKAGNDEDVDFMRECSINYRAKLEEIQAYIDADKEDLKGLYDNYKAERRRHTPRTASGLAQFDRDYFAKIEKIQKRVGKFSDEKSAFNYQKVRKNFANFGIKNAADKVHEFYLNSAAHSKVNPVSKNRGGGKKVSPSNADKMAKRELIKYQKISSFKKKVAESGTGQEQHSKTYREISKRYENARRQAQARFLETEKKWASYCQRSFGTWLMQKNSSKCQRGRKGAAERQRRYAAINNAYMNRIGRSEAQYRRLSGLENEYARRNNQRYGEDSFSSLFGMEDSSLSFWDGGSSNYLDGGNYQNLGTFSNGPGHSFQDPWANSNNGLSFNGPNHYNYNNYSQYNRQFNGNPSYNQNLQFPQNYNQFRGPNY